MRVFDTLYERKNTRSMKWDMLKSVFQSDDILPMWVADVHVQAHPAVDDALIKRAQHGSCGYTVVDNDVKNRIINWNDRRHNWQIAPDWLTFSPGVVTSLHLAIQPLTNPNDKVLIQTPVY